MPQSGHPRFGRAICSHELDQTLTAQVGDMLEFTAVTRVRARSTTVNPGIELETGETSSRLGDLGGTVVAVASVMLLEWIAQLRPFDRTALLGRIPMLQPRSAAARMSGLSVQVPRLFCRLIPAFMDLSGL